MALALTSPAFKSGAEIPFVYAAEDKNLAPPLDFRGVPPGARSLALLVNDLTAAAGEPVAHWIVVDIPPDCRGIGESGLPPVGSREGTNDFGKACWSGPSPSKGRHRYQFKLHALDIALPGLRRPTLAQIEGAMKGHVMAHATLVGTYEKKRKLL